MEKLMSLEDAHRMFKEIIAEENLEFSSVFLGYLESKENMSLGVYEPNENENEIFWGGIENSEIKTMNISLLLHGNKSQRQTQAKALELFEVLEEILYGFTFDNWTIYRLYTIENRPVYVGMDKDNIHEYVINVQIIYKI